jgi:mRNA-degrading endonuclease RelE of RelBE toxin-antitoxin system
MRWSLRGGGKRGGIRVIYFWHEANDTVYLLYAYKKSAKEDLTAKQIRLLANLVREELR